ncbi:MAG: bifunctional lysylphosphatidylglycerol flippase/synthetase MprF [Gammaproteobacteria bacterium]|nr:bifunctional lysylphosphatidylglycerol flippase/synthetase MprF [Gammaproteobacteria bacterium]
MIKPRSGRRAAAFALITLAVFVLAVYALSTNLHKISFSEVLGSIAAQSWQRLAAAAVCAAGSYLMLTGYDYLAVLGIGRRLPYPRVALTSFTAFGISHSAGLSSISGGSVRLRAYAGLGLSALEVAGIMTLVAINFFLGVGTILAISLWVGAEQAARALPISATQSRLIALALAAVLIGYALLTLLKRTPIRVGKREIQLPSLKLTLAQLLVASVDLCFAAATLYLVLPPGLGISYPAFVGLYVLAIQAGVLSNVPGGLGVFESVLLLLLPAGDNDAVLGAVLLYRVYYYLAPLLLAVALLTGREAFEQRHYLRRMLAAVRRWLEFCAPQTLAAAVFAAGTVLLFSGATPGIVSRLRFLRDFLPRQVLEISHLAGSAIGIGLLILARGLWRRLDGAWWLTALLLAAGALASLLKGLDYEEAMFLAVVLLLLLAARGRFYRRAPLLQPKLSAGWWLAIALVVTAAVWVALVSHSHAYTDQPWWSLAFDRGVPRAVRATILSAMLAGAIALLQLLSPAYADPAPPNQAELARAAEIVADTRDTLANLALAGDKQLLFAGSGDAFIMYQRSGRSMVALGDPVGAPARHVELAWRFAELCHRQMAWPVFYQVTVDDLPLYLDLGLALIKLGEEARVSLPRFSLEAPERAELRADHRRAGRRGLYFRLLSPGEVAARMNELKRISDEWLFSKAAPEKGFSVGRFDPAYVGRFSCACAVCDARIVAFANLWQSRTRDELSIDLMRYDADAPPGVMDFLLVELMLWGRDQGYRWFNLGMAPLSGFERHPLAPFWHKLGVLVHHYGRPFYNFQGLRRYKEKFDPVWRPRYLASPGGLVLPRVLLDVAALIAGDVREAMLR